MARLSANFSHDMPYIAHLDLACNQTLPHSHWRQLSETSGVPLRDYEGPLGDWRSLGAFVRGALGMVLHSDCFLHTPEVLSAIHESVGEGHRLLVQIDSSALPQFNPFLARYGMEGTRIAVHDKTARDNSRLFALDKAHSSESFYPHRLLHAVDTVVLQQPHVIRFRGSTTPLLKLPLERALVIDQASDFPVDWTQQDLACMVMSPVGVTGGVLGLSCYFLHDPWLGLSGAAFAGITAANNERLAQNILEWLAGMERDPNELSVTAKAFELVDHIERRLVDIIMSALTRTFTDWWTEGVPEAVRLACAKRSEEEKNRLPKAAYFDLLHLKSILDSNWKLFAPEFASVGWKGNKR